MNVSSLIFRPRSIQALLREIEQPGSGKTQDRRAVKLPTQAPVEYGGTYFRTGCEDRELFREVSSREEHLVRRPWEPGDLLYARETWQYNPFGGIVYRAGSGVVDCAGHGWRPSIHMPREASRITLYLSNVRVDRLQDISDEDALAEGIEHPDNESSLPTHPLPNYTSPFARLWDSINAKRGYDWESNPLVRRLTFRPILANVDAVLSNPEQYGIQGDKP